MSNWKLYAYSKESTLSRKLHHEFSLLILSLLGKDFLPWERGRSRKTSYHPDPFPSPSKTIKFTVVVSIIRCHELFSAYWKKGRGKYLCILDYEVIQIYVLRVRMKQKDIHSRVHKKFTSRLMTMDDKVYVYCSRVKWQLGYNVLSS